MGKTSNQIVEESRKSMVRSIYRVNKLMRHALAKVTPEQFSADMALPQGEAPLLAHVAGKAFVAQMKIDAQSQPPMHVGLSVTVIGKATSMAEWAAMVQPAPRPPELAGRLGIIDVAPEPQQVGQPVGGNGPRDSWTGLKSPTAGASPGNAPVPSTKEPPVK